MQSTVVEKLGDASHEAGMLSFSRLSEDMGLTFCLDRSGKVVRTVGTASAMSTDRQMVKTYKGLLTSVGNTTKKMVVDPSMPYGLEKGVTDGFESVWPEIEKEMCDRFILTNGFSFGTYRKQFQAHTPSQPTSCFQAVVGTLLHATQPYDLSFFGRLRNPLYFAVFMLSLFPLYGVDSLFVIALWLCTYKFDENQCDTALTQLSPSAYLAPPSDPPPSPFLARACVPAPQARRVYHQIQVAPVYHHRPTRWRLRLRQALHLRHGRRARGRAITLLDERPRHPPHLPLRDHPRRRPYRSRLDHLPSHPQL